MPPMIRTAAILAAILLVGVSGRTAVAEPALWKVTNGTTTAYLYGSVHLLKQDAVWDTPKVEAALSQSRELWLEIKDADDQASLRPLVSALGFDRTRVLSGLLDGPHQKKLTRTLSKLSYPPAALNAMQPWLAALTLSLAPLQKAGYDPDAGVDKRLKAAAMSRGMDIEAFETSEAQLHYLADLPQDVQMEMVRQSLDDFDTALEDLNRLEAAWEQGDETAIDRLIREDMPPLLYGRLIKERNVRFASALVARLQKPGVIFVAVGAGHLAGPDSVQAELARQGYIVVRQ